ncbi:MAG TPA: HAD-IA family hydrolase [Ktedonosporobacter sp.]|nr:HAD-IA family hydrolase [Ktedonosporobacter sp.]
MLKAMLFDVDGVLAVSEPWKNKLEREHSISSEMTRMFYREGTFSALVGKADLKEEIAPYLPQWGWPHSVDDFLDYWFSAEDHRNEPLLAFIQQQRQKGIPCYLATMQEQYRTTYILEQMGFASQFDGMFSSCTIGHPKHEPAFFQHILRKLAPIQANEILFWDDTPRNVAIAREAGIHAELYTEFADFQEMMRAYIL